MAEVPSLRLRRVRQLLQGAPAPGPARAPVRAHPDRHLRRRHAHGRVRAYQSLPLDTRAPDRSRSLLARIERDLVYLADGTPLLPSDSAERSEIVRWLIYEQTDIVPATGGLRFRLQTGRLGADDPEVARRVAAGEELLGILDDTLAVRDFLVGGGYSIADIAVYGYVHVADEAGYELSRWPAVQGWLRRVADQPGYMNDLQPYPPNARAGAGHSTYD